MNSKIRKRLAPVGPEVEKCLEIIRSTKRNYKPTQKLQHKSANKRMHKPKGKAFNIYSEFYST